MRPALELLLDSPERGVCGREREIGVGGGLAKTVLLSRLGKDACVFSNQSLYSSSSYCFMDRATARYRLLAWKGR